MDRGGKITSWKLVTYFVMKYIYIYIKRLLVLVKTTYVTSLSHFMFFLVIYWFLPFIVRAHSARHAIWVWSSVKMIEAVRIFQRMHILLRKELSCYYARLGTHGYILYMDTFEISVNTAKNTALWGLIIKWRCSCVIKYIGSFLFPFFSVIE